MPLIKDYELRVGDAICVYQNTLLNRLIFWAERKDMPDAKEIRIAHVALYIGMINNKPMLAEADWKGIKIQSIDKYNNKKYNVFVARPRINIDAIGETRLQIYANNHLNEDYAFIELLKMCSNRVLRTKFKGDWDKHAKICSEFYCRAIKEIFNYEIICGANPADVNPLVLYVSDQMDRLKPIGA
jgi:hypothetical protein